jgi:MFS family permease
MLLTSAARRSDLGRLWQRPGYPGFVLTVALSRICAAMFTTAGVLLVLDRTGSAALAGTTAAASVLPGALSGPLLGAWLDVARRRRVLIVIDQLASVAGLLGIVVLAGHAPNWTVPTVAVLYSITRPLSSGSFFSALAEIAGPELLDRASAIEATSLNLAVVVGPALAGGLASAVGAQTVVELQAAMTAAVAALIAINPVFETRPVQQAKDVMQALRDGTRALVSHRLLRGLGVASMLAAFSWGLMTIAFPLYAAQRLHAGAHAGGYLWAAVAIGSIIGTFALAGTPSVRRVGLSYGVLGLSALLWPLAHRLGAGFLLVVFTGFLEGPAYSGTIALRQRHTPPAVRSQVMTTLTGAAGVALAAGAVVGGVIHRPVTAFVAFTVVNLLAAIIAGRGDLLTGLRRLL